jgi:hypothetical protein
MSYIRKTKDLWILQGYYGYGHGYEDLCYEESRKEILLRLREYKENEKGDYRVICKRENKQGECDGK